MLSHNYPGFSQSQRNNSLSPFSNTGNEDGHLYARHSLGSVFGYGENTMEPCTSCVCVFHGSFGKK